MESGLLALIVVAASRSSFRWSSIERERRDESGRTIL
jgi:hypothetical protein